MICGNCYLEIAMTDRKMFADADVETRRFYSGIISTAMCNLYAVEHQLFDEVFCESDDPAIMERWIEAEPLIMDAIKRLTDADAGEDTTWNF
jgi:hypothetical protein